MSRGKRTEMEELLLNDYRMLAQFRYQLRRFLRFSEEAARAGGLEPQQYLLLLALRGMPEGLEPNIATIAERLQLRHHSAVELVDRMEARGLVRRVRDTRDRRRVSVDVTPTGLEMLERLAHVHLEELTHLAPELCDALQPLLNHRLGPSVVNVKC